ncbi:hypothetical protein ZWY2020_012211 [Hordeum vulgare]|nr:hypothetical protein ZWY2020_012211 [Hordeum vulgare]
MAGGPGRMLVRGCTANKMEMDGGSKYRSRGHTMGSNNYKRLPYLLLLLLAIGAATLSVSVLHKMRERRLLSVLVQEREQQLMSLQVRLENEKEISKEMRRKVDELEAKTSILSIERTELKNKVMNSETTTTYLTNTQKELEAALVEKESHINQMKEIVAASGPDQMSAIKELLQQKEAELEEIKTKFQDYKKPDTEVGDNEVLRTNNENATSDTVAPENSARSDDANQSSDDPPPKGTHSEESELRKSADSQEISKEELDGKKQLDDPQGEVSKEVAREPEKEINSDGEMKISKDSQEINKEELDGKKQSEDSQGEVSYHSKESKLLEQEDGKEVAREPEKEINPDGEMKISKNSLTEANQEIMQVVGPVASPADVNLSLSNNSESKETSKRRRKRKSRSKRRKRTDVAASNVDGEAIKAR